MRLDDSDILEEWGLRLAPVEIKALRWILLDRTRPFCSKDLVEEAGIKSKSEARNIICSLKKHGAIELYCKSFNAFYKLKSINKAEMKKPVTLHRMGSSGLKNAKIDLSALLDSMPAEELCRVHNVRFTVVANKIYPILSNAKKYPIMAHSKDVFFGSYHWAKHQSARVTVHCTGKISIILDCTNCPIESSIEGFVGLAAFLGGLRNQLLCECRVGDKGLLEGDVPNVDLWTVAMWHYGKDSALEFSGEAFNVTFKMWCGLLARIYVHEQERSRKVRFEVLERPRKSLKDVIGKKLNFGCGGCEGCTKRLL